MAEWTDILKKADEWRHLPAYRMEPRVDLFFALFLKDVLMETFDDCEIKDCAIIPEFPIKKNQSNNESYKVDFAAFGNMKGQNTIYLVELKTDMSSIKDDQLTNMKCAKENASKLLCNVKTIAESRNNNHKRKYLHLMWSLHKIVGNGNLSEEFFLVPGYLKKEENGPRAQLVKAMRKIKFNNPDWYQPKIELVLIAPEFGDDDKCSKTFSKFTLICFQEFANSIRKNVSPDESSLREEFACKLEEWACVKPGEQDLEGKNECL